MESDVLTLIVQRLERIERQNDTQTKLLHEHHAYVDGARNAVLAQVDQLRDKVHSHQTYFSMLGWLGLPTFTAAVGYLFTKLGMK